MSVLQQDLSPEDTQKGRSPKALFSLWAPLNPGHERARGLLLQFSEQL